MCSQWAWRRHALVHLVVIGRLLLQNYSLSYFPFLLIFFLPSLHLLPLQLSGEPPIPMEAVVGTPPAADFFNFDSPCSSHYLTAPSSPVRFASSSASAPTSPSRASIFFRHFNASPAFLHRHDHDAPIGSPSAVPFHWEEKPGIPKSPERTAGEDFEFDFSGKLSDQTSVSADELFDGGKIKPLKPPPGFLVNDYPAQSNLSSPRSPHSFKLSPRHKIEIDPFEAAFMKETRSQSGNDRSPEQRGRDRISYCSSSFFRKGTRSLSPFRVSETVLDEEEKNPLAGAAVEAKFTKEKSPISSSSFLSSISFSKGNRKWRLKDLFRSASEGRATDKEDELRKYASMLRKAEKEDDENWSFREAGGGGWSRRGGASVAEELKKKTFLPYKQGMFGCLR